MSLYHFSEKKNDKSDIIHVYSLVRMKGLEPPCLAALDPKSSASTSFATSACLIIINNLSSECNKKFYEKFREKFYKE